jgi:hypothetical protein
MAPSYLSNITLARIIHKWTQEATPTSDTGWVTFRDENDEVVSRYQTKQEKGLYYIQDMEFYPITSGTIAMCQKTEDEDMSLSDTPTIRMQTNIQPHLTNNIDFYHDLAAMNVHDQLQPVIKWIEPRSPFVIAKFKHSERHKLKKIF